VPGSQYEAAFVEGEKTWSPGKWRGTGLRKVFTKAGLLGAWRGLMFPHFGGVGVFDPLMPHFQAPIRTRACEERREDPRRTPPVRSVGPL